ncbi:cysteine-rich CWC family protein [Litorilituus lipolyticus]|nr:cysteine-rich CWC family protein [Litorilituus lipolyticus]
MQEENICPLCQCENHCRVATINDCWCKVLPVPEGLIKQLPEGVKNKRCICQRCVEQYLNQQKPVNS